MPLSQLRKNINRTLASGRNKYFDISGDFFGDNDLCRKKVKLKFERSLTTLLPYNHYDEEQDLYFNEVQITSDEGSKKATKIKVNCGFLLSANPIPGISEEKIDILANLFTDNLPEGLIVQIINYASPRVNNLFDLWKKERTKKGGIYEDLAQRRIDYLNQANWDSLFHHPFVVRDFRLYISAWLDIERYPNVPNQLKDLREIFQSNLQNIGINTCKVYPSDFLSFQDEIFNPQKSKTYPEEIRWDPLNRLNTQAIDNESYFDVTKNRIEIRDDLAISSFSVKNYPELWPAWENKNLLGSENNDFLRLSCPFAQIFTFLTLPKEASDTKIMIKSSRSTSQSNSKMRAFIPGIEQKAKDLKFAYDHIQKGKRLVEAQYRILLFSDRKTLTKEEETLRGLFKTLGWNISRDDMLHLPCFLSSMPFWLNEDLWKEFKLMNKVKTLISWTSANVAPLIAEYKGSMNEPRMMLIGKRGQPVLWNSFVGGGNPNCAVIGMSGAGKSVWLQEEVTAIMAAGGMSFIIDDGMSFVNSSLLQGGKFIEIKENTCINPFTMFEWKDMQEYEDYSNAIQNFFTSLISQICRPITPINEDEKALISLAVLSVLNKEKDKGKLESISRELLLVARNAKQKEIAESLQLSLDVFIKKYGRFFEGESNIKMDNNLIVFELSNIKGDEMSDLRSVVMIILMHLICERVYKGDRKTPFSLTIDEAWFFLSGEGLNGFLGPFARRIRKYNGKLVTGTQSINDYYKTPAALSVLDNSQYKIFLTQNPDSIDYIKKHNVISMDRTLEEALKSLTTVNGCYSDVLIYSKNSWFIARLILDPFSAFLYSSTSKEVARLQDLKMQGLSITEAVLKIAEEQNKLLPLKNNIIKSGR